MQWRMWAYEEKNGSFLNFGPKWWVALHGYDLPTIPVIITEDAEGDYYGWMDDIGKGVPSLIWRTKNLFESCFADGYEYLER